MGYILVVEDDPHIRLLISRKLQNAGYEVRTSANGEDALAKALSDIPQIMLLDVMLPDSSGLDICRTVKDELGEQSPPIMIISAFGQTEDVQRGMAAGADDYLIKPFAPSELLAHVQHLTRR